MRNDRWATLHDASLESIVFRWLEGDVVITVRTGDPREPRLLLVASAVRRLDCSRQMPWGHSVSINELQRPTPISENTVAVLIEMQSGDLIRIEAGAFSWQTLD